MTTLKAKRVLVLIGGHLATAPRPQKEAAAAKSAGAEVRICGIWSNPRLAEEDQELASRIGISYFPVIDLRPQANARSVHRLIHRAAREVFERTGIATARAFGLGAPEMVRAAEAWKPDLVMAHSEAALWAGAKLLRKGFRVGADFEDWFSEDLLPEARQRRPIRQLKELERLFVRRGFCQFAPTRVMAEALAQDAGSARVPVHIPNAFPFEHLEGTLDPRPQDAVCFYWFSQTIGPGRGLETLAAALRLVTGSWRLYVRGNLALHRDWFARTFTPEIADRVVVLDPVPNAELARRSRAYDIGLALEEPFCRSRDLTATNKLFEYFRCGLAVIATRTAGQQEVLSKAADAGVLVSPGEPAELAAVMQRWIDDPAHLKRAKEASGQAGRGDWNWTRFASRIPQALSIALAQP